jgi:tRNA dimethylallyltransferase
MPQEKQLICLVGPTAIGKTTMAAALARIFESEVISADSRQFYKEMKIGTAVPKDEEMMGVPHHFIQHLSITDDYNVGQFEQDALKKLDILFQLHERLFLVGGSGLYVDAVVHGLDDFPKVPIRIRENLRSRLADEGLAVLVDELKQVDPESYKRIDLANPQRVLRALEVYHSSGNPISHYWRKKSSQRNFSSIVIGLTTDRETIYRRIDKRVDQMMEEGLEAEARALYGQSDLNALQTVGYKELFGFFKGKLSREEAVAEIKKNSRRYAKRQGTWFRKNPCINWFDFKSPPELIADRIKKGGLIQTPC